MTNATDANKLIVTNEVVSFVQNAKLIYVLTVCFLKFHGVVWIFLHSNKSLLALYKILQLSKIFRKFIKQQIIVEYQISNGLLRMLIFRLTPDVPKCVQKLIL